MEFGLVWAHAHMIFRRHTMRSTGFACLLWMHLCCCEVVVLLERTKKKPQLQAAGGFFTDFCVHPSQLQLGTGFQPGGKNLEPIQWPHKAQSLGTHSL